jgi:S1-C subfamily serine protease
VQNVTLLILFFWILTGTFYAKAENSSLKKEAEATVATAFLVAPGYLVTAHHAIRGKQKIFIAPERDGTFTVAEMVGFSEDLDIALIRASVKGNILKIGHWQTFPRGAETHVIGFPKIGRLVSEKRITTGIYNGEQRFGARQDWFQLSAEIQKGNSGSPVIGADGKVYGVISHKLDAQKIAKKYGDLPQNVNFALKSSKLLEFLAMYDIKVSSGVFNSGDFSRPYEVFNKNENSIFLLLGKGDN